MSNTITHYHGLAPCFLKTPWKRVWFNLSIPFPRPLIHAQTHPNSSNHVQRVLTVKPIFKEKLNVILVQVRYWFYRRGSRKPGIWKQHLDRNCAKLINQTDIRTFKQHVLAKKVPNHPKRVKFPHKKNVQPCPTSSITRYKNQLRCAWRRSSRSSLQAPFFSKLHPTKVKYNVLPKGSRPRYLLTLYTYSFKFML